MGFPCGGRSNLPGYIFALGPGSAGSRSSDFSVRLRDMMFILLTWKNQLFGTGGSLTFGPPRQYETFGETKSVQLNFTLAQRGRFRG